LPIMYRAIRSTGLFFFVRTYQIGRSQIGTDDLTGKTKN